MSRTMGPGHYLPPVKQSDGTTASKAGKSGVYTLTATTYFVEINTQTSTHESIHLQWNTALVGVITVESTDFGFGTNEADLTYNVADGTWIQQNPSTAYVPIVGTGATVSDLTITLAGGGDGGAEINLSALAPARLRLRLAITTGGTIRIAHTGKA